MGHMSWSLLTASAGLPGVSLVAAGRLGSPLSNLFSGYTDWLSQRSHILLSRCPGSGSGKGSFPLLWGLGTRGCINLSFTT